MIPNHFHSSSIWSIRHNKYDRNIGEFTEYHKDPKRLFIFFHFLQIILLSVRFLCVNNKNKTFNKQISYRKLALLFGIGIGIGRIASVDLLIYRIHHIFYRYVKLQTQLDTLGLKY